MMLKINSAHILCIQLNKSVSAFMFSPVRKGLLSFYHIPVSQVWGIQK
jgi:hypothetical protein